MIDLHIHTVYSDGEFKEEEIIDRITQPGFFSITDHNSVHMYVSLGKIISVEKCPGLIIGTELTVEGHPDYLVYYPDLKINDFDALARIEGKLQLIRLTEQDAIKKAYEYLKANDRDVHYSEWESDFSPITFQDGYLIEARTSDLANIRKKHRNNGVKSCENKNDLREARIARRSIHQEIEIDPLQIVKDTGGIVVLAHPIRTAYIHSGREKAGIGQMEEYLKELLSSFYQSGGRCVECEYIDENPERHPLVFSHAIELRSIVMDAIEKYGFQVVWGTDSHKHFPADTEKWSNENEKIFYDSIPVWLQRKDKE